MRAVATRPPLRLAAGSLVATLALAASMTVAVGGSARADQTYYVPVSRSWVLLGHGFGHGHGMSQYGAQGAALQGVGYRGIIGFYYPHTTWARAKGKIRVLISAATSSDLVVQPAKRLTVRDLRDGAHWRLPHRGGIDLWRLTPVRDGSTAVQFHNAKGWHHWRIPDGRASFRSDGQFQAARPLNLVLASGTRRYRGALRLVRPAPGSSSRDTVNVLSMDAYVQGVVPYEMPASWRQQALRAQAVAARTFAAWERSQHAHGSSQICDTTSCQVYGGVAAEQRSSNVAVHATAGQIVTYHGRPAMTQFSSSSGGWTVSGGIAYLPARADPYDGFAANPMHSWRKRVSTASLHRAYPGIGRLVDLRVTSRDGHGAWQGRIERAVLEGTKGRVHVTGDDLRWHYGLLSAWFAVKSTAITKRWRNLGGKRSPLGRATSGEYRVLHGAAQNFARGRILWNRRTGAHELTGAILGKYRVVGGPASRLGWPVTGMSPAPRHGNKARFQRGAIYTHRGAGSHLVFGPVMDRWRRSGGANGSFGYPTRDLQLVRGGVVGRFQHGVIRWDRSSNRFVLKHH
jgi:stage II sporulation protein D